MNALSTIHYDLEVVKMQASHSATKKDLDSVDNKFYGYVKIETFEGLEEKVNTLTPKDEHQYLKDQQEKTVNNLKRYALAKEVYDHVNF